MQIIKRIKDWQTERMLDKQPYEWQNEATNIIEELVEAKGYKVVDREKLKKMVGGMINNLEFSGVIEKRDSFDDVDIADAFCDVIVFAVGALMKAGFEPTCALDETLKEIESRKGKIKNGKFQKDTSLEAKAKWVKADYEKCRKEII